MDPFISPKDYKLILTCEHASNLVPTELKTLFLPYKELLNTHLGYDIGALILANFLKKISDYYLFAKYSRLIIDLNRSLHHRNAFSFITKFLPLPMKEMMIEKYYDPYRKAVLSRITDFIQNGFFVFHLSIHSFTATLNQKERNCDIGLLYDPTHLLEAQFCHSLKQQLIKINPALKLRFNYPYLGKSDGFTSFLRKNFLTNYIGIEIEVNQNIFLTKQSIHHCINNDLLKGLQTILKIEGK
jgi:predicted N-formylglutamate amidohydrolase